MAGSKYNEERNRETMRRRYGTPGVDPNTSPSAFYPGGGGVVGAIRSMSGYAGDVQAGYYNKAKEFLTGTPAMPKPAAMPTASTPSKPTPISQQIYGDPNVLSRTPAQRYVAGQIDQTYPSAAGLAPMSKLVPKPTFSALQGNAEGPTTARAALAPGQFTAVGPNGQAIGGNAAQYAKQLDQADRMKGMVQGRNDPQAAERYRKFMEGSLQRGVAMQERNAPDGRPPMAMTRNELAEERRGTRQERIQKEGAQLRQTEVASKQQLERDIAKMKADSEVAAAAAGKASPKSENAALLKEYVALYENATDEERKALWPKIEALTASANPAQAQGQVQEGATATNKEGKKLKFTGGKWIPA